MFCVCRREEYPRAHPRANAKMKTTPMPSLISLYLMPPNKPIFLWRPLEDISTDVGPSPMSVSHAEWECAYSLVLFSLAYLVAYNFAEENTFVKHLSVVHTICAAHLFYSPRLTPTTSPRHQGLISSYLLQHKTKLCLLLRAINI